MKCLITGAGGVVGTALSAGLLREHPASVLVDRQFRAPEPAQARRCDLESPEAVRQLIDDVQPDVVIHVAGNKDVFALENEPALARRSNLETTRNLVGALSGSGTHVIFISTDYVFEGTAGPYAERSPTRPTTEYGKSKLAAEICLQESGLPVAIARSAALYGYPNDFVSVVRSQLGAGRRFGAFANLVSNPTYVEDLLEMLNRLVNGRLTGVFHLCGNEPLSRYQFASMIAAAFGFDAELVHREERTERVRPADLSLANAATRSALGYTPRSVELILKSMLIGNRLPMGQDRLGEGVTPNAVSGRSRRDHL